MRLDEILAGWFPTQTEPARPETEAEKGVRLRANAAKIRWHVWGKYPTFEAQEAYIRGVLGEEEYDTYVRDTVSADNSYRRQQWPSHTPGGVRGICPRDE